MIEVQLGADEVNHDPKVIKGTEATGLSIRVLLNYNIKLSHQKAQLIS
jgi:hypothetical protein